MGGGKGGDSDAGDMIRYGEEAQATLEGAKDVARADFQPWQAYGKKAGDTILDRLGLSGNTGAAKYGDMARGFGAADFQADPGYQFRLGEGQKAIDRRMAAQGKYFTPEAAKALAEYNQGMAADEYGDAYNRFTNDQSNIYSRLFGLSGQGLQAAGGQANAALGTGSLVADVSLQQGNAITAAREAARNRQSSFFNTLIGAGAGIASAAAGNPGGAFAAMRGGR